MGWIETHRRRSIIMGTSSSRLTAVSRLYRHQPDSMVHARKWYACLFVCFVAPRRAFEAGSGFIWALWCVEEVWCASPNAGAVESCPFGTKLEDGSTRACSEPKGAWEKRWGIERGRESESSLVLGARQRHFWSHTIHPPDILPKQHFFVFSLFIICMRAVHGVRGSVSLAFVGSATPSQKCDQAQEVVCFFLYVSMHTQLLPSRMC